MGFLLPTPFNSSFPSPSHAPPHSVEVQPPVNEPPANQNKADRQKNPINSSQDSSKLKIDILYYFVTVLYFRYLKKINSDRNGIALFFQFSNIR